MRILWLCNIMLPKIATSLGNAQPIFGGWLTGLSNDLLCENSIELTVCFPVGFQKELIFGQVENMKYYGFPNVKKSDSQIEKYFENIIKEINPDIIHIFGTEFSHTLSMINACEKLMMLDKTIVYIQGLTSICYKHYLSLLPYKVLNSFTIRDFIKKDNIILQSKSFKKRGNLEIESLKKCKHIVGRTDWDKATTEQINPTAKYHFCNETLRDEFYKHRWSLNTCERNSIFISQWNYPIKGFHFMLEAMPKILKKYPNAHIYTTGESPLSLKKMERLKKTYYQKYIGDLIIKYKLEDKVTFLGQLNEKKMCEAFLKAHVFVLPSTIENSPNSLGEAMILGLPSVSSDVGGVKNMMMHAYEGYIYPYDESYMIAYYVCKIFDDDELALKISDNAKIRANLTHNRKTNLNSIISIYEEIIN